MSRGKNKRQFLAAGEDKGIVEKMSRPSQDRRRATQWPNFERSPLHKERPYAGEMFVSADEPKKRESFSAVTPPGGKEPSSRPCRQQFAQRAFPSRKRGGCNCPHPPSGGGTGHERKEQGVAVKLEHYFGYLRSALPSGNVWEARRRGWRLDVLWWR